MHIALEELLDLIADEGGILGDLAAAVDRESWEGLPELARAAAPTDWRDCLNAAIMEGVNNGQ